MLTAKKIINNAINPVHANSTSAQIRVSQVPNTVKMNKNIKSLVYQKQMMEEAQSPGSRALLDGKKKSHLNDI